MQPLLFVVDLLELMVEDKEEILELVELVDPMDLVGAEVV
jgi:hypothetical protein